MSVLSVFAIGSCFHMCYQNLRTHFENLRIVFQWLFWILTFHIDFNFASWEKSYYSSPEQTGSQKRGKVFRQVRAPETALRVPVCTATISRPGPCAPSALAIIPSRGNGLRGAPGLERRPRHPARECETSATGHSDINIAGRRWFITKMMKMSSESND